MFNISPWPERIVNAVWMQYKEFLWESSCDWAGLGNDE